MKSLSVITLLVVAILLVSACVSTRTVYNPIDIDNTPVQDVIKPDMVIKITTLDDKTTLVRVAGYEGDEFLIGYELIDYHDYTESKVKIAINNIKDVHQEDSMIESVGLPWFLNPKFLLIIALAVAIL